MTQDDYAALISSAKAVIDRGFSRVGKTLDAKSRTERALMLLAGRAVAIGNALVLLAQHQLPNEALPLLRSLLEISVWMRWIAQADSDRRAAEFFEESRSSDWAGLWRAQRLRERMKALEFPETAWNGPRSLMDGQILLFCFDHLHGNAQGLPWGHVFDENKSRGVSVEELLRIAAFASGHAVKALDARWPGSFEGAEDMWRKAKVA